MAHGLGRRHAPDERDRAYPMRAVVPSPPPERRWRYWWTGGLWANQGATGTCVGHAWAHWAEDGPVTQPGVLDPFQVYREAVLLDEWAENDGEADGPRSGLQFGTSVRAGAKALEARGYLSEYRWGWTLRDVTDALLTTGPVVVGTWWWSGMFDPDGDGYVRPTGSREGGHAYVLDGVNLDHGKLRLKNSWGRGWGRKGFAWLDLEDLAALLEDWGEACLALERRVR